MEEQMVAAFYEISGKLAELRTTFQQGMAWYKQEMDNLKSQLAEKDKEIAELKRQLNEKSS